MNDEAPGKVDQLAPTPPGAPPREDATGPLAKAEAEIIYLKRFQGDLIGITSKLELQVGHFTREAQKFTAGITGLHLDVKEIRDTHATKAELKELAAAVQRLTLACVTIIDQQKEILARMPGRRPATRSKAARTRGEVS